MNTQDKRYLASPLTDNYFSGRNALFVHNWRTGGTSLHVLLKANLLSRYIKIGDQFNRFGKSNRAKKPIATLSDVRRRTTTGSIVAGHLYAGLESLLPGSWDLWFSAREPLARVKSGLLRFHSRELPNFNATSRNIIKSSPSLTSPESVQALLRTDLLHEASGMARRLACLTLTDSYAVNNSTNLERPPFLSDQYDDAALYEASLAQLDNIRIIFMADQLSASVLCLERCYGLPPVINPFARLHCNSSAVVGYDASHVDCLERSTDILRRSQRVDLELWPLLQQRFKQQLLQYQIEKSQIMAKELIHSSPLFSPDWFLADASPSQIVDTIANALTKRLQGHEHLARYVIDMVCDWPCLSLEIRDSVRHKLSC